MSYPQNGGVPGRGVSLQKLFFPHLFDAKGGESKERNSKMPLLEQAQRFFAALNAHDLNTAVAMLSPSANIRTPLGSFTGGEAYREWILMHFRALPDFTHEIRGMTAESNQTLAFELHATGTMTGPLALSDGDLSPTGRTIDISAADFWQFENGLIVEYHLYFDRRDFFNQLGLPIPEGDTKE
jgi:steroid delta-isomerase-like uncharacterized protein